MQMLGSRVPSARSALAHVFAFVFALAFGAAEAAFLSEGRLRLFWGLAGGFFSVLVACALLGSAFFKARRRKEAGSEAGSASAGGGGAASENGGPPSKAAEAEKFFARLAWVAFAGSAVCFVMMAEEPLERAVEPIIRTLRY